MKRKSILLFLLSAVTCFFATAQNADSVANRIIIGYFNKQEVLNVLPEAVQFEAEYSKIKAEYEEQFNALTEEYDKKVQNFLEKRDNVSNAMRLALQTEITELESRINLYKKRYQNDLSKRRSNFYTPIESRIDEAISQVCSERNIAIVFDKSTPVYVSSQCEDITPYVKIKLGL